MKKGDMVALTEKAKKTAFCPKGRMNYRLAQVVAFLSDYEGGVMVSRDLGGCKYWNRDDLVVVRG